MNFRCVTKVETIVLLYKIFVILLCYCFVTLDLMLSCYFLFFSLNIKVGKITYIYSYKQNIINKYQSNTYLKFLK